MQRKEFYCFLCIFVVWINLFSIPCFAEIDDSSVNVKWDYKGNLGPVRWGQLNPAFALCIAGQMQSPINIKSNNQFQKILHQLTFDYHPAPMAIVEDGVTTLTLAKVQTIIHDGHGIQLNFPSKNIKEVVNFEGKSYRLVQLHFHSPSEHALNGQTFAMEIHFVHQGAEGQVLIIAVFVKAGVANAGIQKIIQNLPTEKGVEIRISDELFDPTTLLPHNQAYYSFRGSLTTPPCTEALQWIIMPHAIRAASGQILLLRKAMGGENARPIQSRNHRKIYFSPG